MEIERDMPECEHTITYDEPSVYELAEQELKAQEQKFLIQEMMGEQYDKYFWDEKHAL